MQKHLWKKFLLKKKEKEKKRDQNRKEMNQAEGTPEHVSMLSKKINKYILI